MGGWLPTGGGKPRTLRRWLPTGGGKPRTLRRWLPTGGGKPCTLRRWLPTGGGKPRTLRRVYRMHHWRTSIYYDEQWVKAATPLAKRDEIVIFSWCPPYLSPKR